MFSLGFGEILVICVILIIVVGPERLPTLMKGVGKTMRTVREASREIRTTVGLDELMRDDPPRPVYRPPPAATVARAQTLPAPVEEPKPDPAPITEPVIAPPANDPPPAAEAQPAAPSPGPAADPAPQPGDSGTSKSSA